MSDSEKPWWRAEFAIETYKTIGIAGFFFLFMPTLLFQPFRIPSGSMEGTLEIGDYLFVSKYPYGYSQYSFPFGVPVAFAGRVMEGQAKRGDVVVFKRPADPLGEHVIKRVVGVGGDRVQMIEGVLHINGEAVQLVRLKDRVVAAGDGSEVRVARYSETLPGGVTHIVLDEGPAAFDDTEEFAVPAGHYFMMGDNRDRSSDSRDPMGGIGFVPEQNLVGRAEMVFFSHDGSAQLWEVWKWPLAIRYGRLLNMIG